MMKSEDLENIPIHFIVGSARSGTTLLSTIFNQHSEVLSTTENDFLLYFLKDFFHADFSKKEVRNKLQKFLKNRKKRVINIWSTHPDFIESLKNENDGIKSYPEFCKRQYIDYGNRYFSKSSVKMILDKNPTYTLHIRKLMHYFPDSKFVALVRDYRDVISSQKRFFSLLKLIPIYGYIWNTNNKLIFDCLKEHPDRFILVKYEDLVNAPQISIERICDFLSIRFELKMLEYHKNLSPVFKQAQENLTPSQKLRVSEMFSLITQPVSKERIGASEKELTRHQLKLADFITGKTGAKFGYLPRNKFNQIEKIYWTLLTFPVLLISAFQIKFFNYHYYYLPINVRKIAELFNIPLLLKRMILGYKK